MKSCFFAASLLMVSTSLALSADFPQSTTNQELAADGFDWRGSYSGIHAGWNWTKGEDNSGNPSVEFDGGTIGIFAGHNHMMDRMLIGAEIDANFNDLSNVGIASKIRSDWNAGVSARIGYAFDSLLPYARIGVGVQEGYQRGLTSGRRDTKLHKYLEGGIGLEAAVSDKLSLRGEVVHRKATKETYQLNNPYKGDFKNTLFRVGLAYHY